MKTINPIIEKLEAHIIDNCKAINPEDSFNEMLDDCYSFKGVGGPFEHMSPSRVLLECDPIAHRCGVSDYADGQGWIEIGNDYYNSDDIEAARESFIEDMDNQIADLENQIEDLEDEERPQATAGLHRQIADLKADIEACKKYVF